MPPIFSNFWSNSPTALSDPSIRDLQVQLEVGVSRHHLELPKATLLSIIPLLVSSRINRENSLALAKDSTEIVMKISRLVERAAETPLLAESISRLDETLRSICTLIKSAMRTNTTFSSHCRDGIPLWQVYKAELNSLLEDFKHCAKANPRLPGPDESEANISESALPFPRGSNVTISGGQFCNTTNGNVVINPPASSESRAIAVRTLHLAEETTLILGGLGTSLSSTLSNVIGRGLASFTEEMRMVLPRSVRFGPENALILKDAFGKELTLQMDFCHSQDALHNLLMLHFRGKIGERYVEEYKYRISSEDGNSIATSDPVVWCSVVKKGSTIVMSMEVRREMLSSAQASERQRKICPRCGRTDIGAMQDEGWLECLRCERRFNSAEGTIEVKAPPVNEDNIVDFRNFHIVLVKQSLSSRSRRESVWRRFLDEWSPRKSDMSDPEECSRIEEVQF